MRPSPRNLGRLVRRRRTPVLPGREPGQGGPDGDPGAGVREPRRPRPSPGGAAAVAVPEPKQVVETGSAPPA